MCGTPGYYVVRCTECCDDAGTFQRHTPAGRAKAVKLWNRIQSNYKAHFSEVSDSERRIK